MLIPAPANAMFHGTFYGHIVPLECVSRRDSPCRWVVAPSNRWHSAPRNQENRQTGRLKESAPPSPRKGAAHLPQLGEDLFQNLHLFPASSVRLLLHRAFAPSVERPIKATHSSWTTQLQNHILPPEKAPYACANSTFASRLGPLGSAHAVTATVE